MPLIPAAQAVYTTFYNVVTYFEDNFDQTTPINSYSLLLGIEATCQDLKNAMYTLMIPSVSYEITYIQEVASLVKLDPIDATFVSNRIDGLLNFTSDLSALSINPARYNLANMQNGESAVSFPDFIQYFMTNTWETPPVGLTSSNFLQESQNEATAWNNFLGALEGQSVPFTSFQYEAVNVMADITNSLANDLTILTISPEADLNLAWNQVVFLESAWRFFLLFTSDPTNDFMQSFQMAAFRMDSFIQSIEALILSVRQNFQSQLLTGTVFSNDTLMSFANRNLQDYSQWTNVAVQNNLLPPYIGNVQGNNVTTPGSSLVLPSALGNATVGSPQATFPIQNYELDYLGTDWYMGNPEDTDLPPWRGDIGIIFGYNNYSMALGRRLVTPLGSLYYEPDYGSRIPGELGEIQAFISTGLLQAQAESAILADPRTASINNSSVFLNEAMQIAYQGTAIPNGPGVTGSQVNQVFASP